eukprot:73571-Pelagomonas_calceolata.AAC.1
MACCNKGPLQDMSTHTTSRCSDKVVLTMLNCKAFSKVRKSLQGSLSIRHRPAYICQCVRALSACARQVFHRRQPFQWIQTCMCILGACALWVPVQGSPFNGYKVHAHSESLRKAVPPCAQVDSHACAGQLFFEPKPHAWRLCSKEADAAGDHEQQGMQ